MYCEFMYSMHLIYFDSNNFTIILALILRKKTHCCQIPKADVYGIIIQVKN